MTSKNTTNYKFLKDFRPELYKLTIKMEEDLLIAPISILAYSTRFLEYILHDIVNERNYNINKKVGYVEKINEIIRFGYEYTDFCQLLIDAYIARNHSIHNYNILKSLKDDKKIAFELNETLFHIADVYYKNITKDNEVHIYTEPKLIKESQKKPVKIKQNKKDNESQQKAKTIKKSQKINKKDKSTDFTETKVIVESQSSNTEKQGTTEYIGSQNSQDLDERDIHALIKFLEEGYSQQSALRHVDINQNILNNWYMNKKSEFIDGLKDSLFIKYNEILIKNAIKSITESKGLGNNGPKIEFWMEYFEEFIDGISKNLTDDQLRIFRMVFKRYDPKKDMPVIDKEPSNKNIPAKSNISKEELEKRKNLMLKFIDKNNNFKIALKKSKLGPYEFQKSKKDFLDGKGKNFYYKLSQKLMAKYLSSRNKGVSTAQFCRKMAISEIEVEVWKTNKMFGDFQIRYNRVLMNLFSKSAKNNKTQEAMLNDLEMKDVEQLNELIKLVNEDAEYIQYREIIKKYYKAYSIEFFMTEFRKNPDIEIALKKANLQKSDLKIYLNLNKELSDEFIKIKLDEIVKILITQGKINNDQLNKLDMTKEDYSQFEEKIKKMVFDKQIKEITNGLSDGMFLITANSVGCDIDTVFDWILMGSVDDNEFSEFANRYWETHIDNINSLNSNNEGTNLKSSQNNLEVFGIKNHKSYWKKWGLIDKNYSNLTISDIKKLLKEVNK